MEALKSVMDSLAWPEFPATPGAQAAFIAATISILIGLALLVFPTAIGHFLKLESRETRPGAIGELRASGGFVAGLALATLMFGLPVFYTALGLAFAVSAFGRIVSLMSDRAVSLQNFLLLLVQVVLAGALLYYFSAVFTSGMQFAMPDETQPLLAFYTYVAVAAAGALMLFAPRISSWIAGIGGISDAGFTSVRSAGGFAIGASIFGILLVGDPRARAEPFANLLYINLAFAVALAFAVFGRLIALALNRGNSIYAIAALITEAAAAALVFGYVAAILQ